MDPVALIDLRASFRNGQVHMAWKFPPSAPDTVHVFPCETQGSDIRLDSRGHIPKNLADCPEGFSFESRSGTGSDVRKMEYCVYLANRNDHAPNLRLLQSSPAFLVSVISGKANISYDIKRKPWKHGLAQHRIWVTSSAEIAPGILGYSYYFYDKEIAVEFPGMIRKGSVEYPPIYLILDAEPSIGVIGGTNADISVIRQKLPFLQRMLKSKKYSG